MSHLSVDFRDILVLWLLRYKQYCVMSKMSKPLSIFVLFSTLVIIRETFGAKLGACMTKMGLVSILIDLKSLRS